MSDQVIIVGGGLSGLSAAKLLWERGINVLVLEASERIGGRLHTVKNSSVGYTDVGGAYIGPSQERLGRLAAELGVNTYKVYSDKSVIHFRKGKIYKTQEAFLPISAGLLPFLDINSLMRKIDELGEKIPRSNPWDAPDAEILDKMTFKEWLQKIIWTEHGMDSATQFTGLNFTAEPHDVSLLWALWYIKCAGGTASINSTENGAQESKFVGGAQQIPEKIAEKLGVGERVLTGKCVVTIEQHSDYVKVSTLDGQTFEGSHVVLAVPPALQRRMIFQPPLPGQRNQLLSKYPMGSVIKTMMFYERPYWREKGFNGGMEVDDNDLNLPVGNTFDDCKPDGTKPCIMGFIFGEKATKFSSLSKEDRMKLIAKQYSVVFSCPEMEKPVHYEEKDWTAEPWTGGCYTGYLGPGVLTAYRDTLRRPVGRLYMAGTETANSWTGYMEGAIQAGERAAREILCDMKLIDETEIWKDEDVADVGLQDLGLLRRHAPSVRSLLQALSALTLSSIALVLAKL